MRLHAFRLGPPDHPVDRDGTPPHAGGFPDDREGLPYRVEVWDDAGAQVEQIVSVSVSASIGYAAFYAATREYPGRTITLRHQMRVLSQWAARTH